MFPAEKGYQTKKKIRPRKEKKWRTGERHWQYCVYALRKWLKPETIQLLSTEVEKSYGDGHGSFPTRNFSTKENERHSLCAWSTHDAAPVWSDKGLISYDRLLQLRLYRTPINFPAINLLHQTLFPSICSCLTSIRASFSCLQVLVSIWR